MTSTAILTEARLTLRPFQPADAAVVADWVRTAEELHWLAPSTQRPLTVEKVMGWKKPGGYAFVSHERQEGPPVGYGELNPMRREPDHFWVGHLIVSPDQRRRRIGQRIVAALIDRAFEDYCAARVSLIVFPENVAAVACYRRAGFSVVGEEHHAFREGGPKLRLLRLEIRSPKV